MSRRSRIFHTESHRALMPERWQVLCVSLGCQPDAQGLIRPISRAELNRKASACLSSCYPHCVRRNVAYRGATLQFLPHPEDSTTRFQ